MGLKTLNSKYPISQRKYTKRKLDKINLKKISEHENLKGCTGKTFKHDYVN